MRVLMISADRTLLGQANAGDTIARHKAYANAAGALDIIVFSSNKQAPVVLSNNLKVFSTGSSKLRHLQSAKKLAEKFIKGKPCDLLVTQDLASPVGAKLKKQFNLPWIVSIHGMFWDKELIGNSITNRFLGWLIKKSLKQADGFRVNNALTEAKLQSWGIRKPVLVQPTAIDVSRFFTDRNFGESVKSILFVGRLSKEKNLPLLINTFKKLPVKAELVIVGKGPEKANLEKLSAEDHRIKFLGGKTIEELPAVFNSAQIFILPSNSETFGQVLLQAAASGCAIVATKTVGAESLIKNDETGLLVPIGDESALSEAMSRLIEKASLRASLARSAQVEARKYDSKSAINRVVDFWKSIASLNSHHSQGNS